MTIPRYGAWPASSTSSDPISQPQLESRNRLLPSMRLPRLYPLARRRLNRAAASADPVTPAVLAIVAEKTGYPQDMLDLELDLEADLGIDTVKQAETLAAIREAFHIPFQESLSLRDYPTLQSVVGFVYKFRPDLAMPANETSDTGEAKALATAGPVSTVGPEVKSLDPVTPKVLAIVAEKTGYPQDMLDLELDLEADLGIDTVKQAETFASIREAFGIPFQESLSLREYPTLQSVVGFVYQFRPDLATQAKDTAASDASEEPDALVPEIVSAHQAEALPAAHSGYSLEAANRIPRRVPVPVLRPALELCKGTGVQLGSSSRGRPDAR